MNLHEFDMQYYGEYPLLCGMDEAGRGPLAGDVFAAAVILAYWYQHDRTRIAERLKKAYRKKARKAF